MLEGVDEIAASDLLGHAAFLLTKTGELREALVDYGIALLTDLQRENWSEMRTGLSNIAYTLRGQNRLAKAESYWRFALDIATLRDNEEDLFCSRIDLFAQFTIFNQRKDAEAMWQLLDPMGRNWSRSIYRSGDAECLYAEFLFRQGDLKEKHLVWAEQLAQAGRSRAVIRDLHRLRGEWQLEKGQWALAAESLHEAVRMAREIGQRATAAETLLAIARFHLNQLPDPEHEAEQLAGAKTPFHRALAELWLLIGNAEQAKKHALAAYELAWADGEPYVYRHELNKARALLDKLDAEIPKLPPYDPAKDEKLPWEDEVISAIEKLRAKVNAKKQAKNDADAGEEE